MSEQKLVFFALSINQEHRRSTVLEHVYFKVHVKSHSRRKAKHTDLQNTTREERYRRILMPPDMDGWLRMVPPTHYQLIPLLLETREQPSKAVLPLISGQNRTISDTSYYTYNTCAPVSRTLVGRRSSVTLRRFISLRRLANVRQPPSCP